MLQCFANCIVLGVLEVSTLSASDLRLITNVCLCILFSDMNHLFNTPLVYSHLFTLGAIWRNAVHFFFVFIYAKFSLLPSFSLVSGYLTPKFLLLLFVMHQSM